MAVKAHAQLDRVLALALGTRECITKVKCDHGSKFSNLSNWKEEA